MPGPGGDTPLMGKSWVKSVLFLYTAYEKTESIPFCPLGTHLVLRNEEKDQNAQKAHVCGTCKVCHTSRYDPTGRGWETHA